jgi:DNA polymerase-3 subunit alpha
MDWELLERFSDGLMASSACLRGPLAQPLLQRQDIEAATTNLARLLDIFGDRFYIELHRTR